MTAQIWEVVEPLDTEFAQASLRSPSQLVGTPICKRCYRGARRIFPKPLVIEWEPGSTLVGDFIWPGGGRVTTTRTAFDALTRESGSIHAEKVEMVQDPKLKPPKTAQSKRSKSRIWLPYMGPELVELWIDHTVPYLPTTTTEIDTKCAECGYETRILRGIEEKSHRWDKEKRSLVVCHTPRDPEKGIFVSATALRGIDLFRIDEFNHAVLCTDEMKSYIETLGLSNVDFLDVGNAV